MNTAFMGLTSSRVSRTPRDYQPGHCPAQGGVGAWLVRCRIVFSVVLDRLRSKIGNFRVVGLVLGLHQNRSF